MHAQAMLAGIKLPYMLMAYPLLFKVAMAA
jgi:hypothetical protein